MNGSIEPRPLALALLLTLGLAACLGDDPQRALLADYLARIERVTEARVELPPATDLPAFPAPRDLTLEIPEHGIDVVEFIELHRCDMGDLVGLRNSPLGRMQGASQRLGYEAAWLRALDACGTAAPEWMTRLGAEKRRVLPALFWNATFAGPEMRAALASAQGAAPAAQDATQTEGLSSGNELADILRGLNDNLDALGAGRFETADLEVLLARLREGGWVLSARLDWQLWRSHLSAAAAALNAARPGICLNGQPTPRSRILSNVFMQFYVAQIQPELALRMRSDEAWLRELTRLAERLAGVRPMAFEVWLDAVATGQDSEWQRTRRAIVDHAKSWQRLFAHCGIEPIPGVGQD